MAGQRDADPRARTGGIEHRARERDEVRVDIVPRLVCDRGGLRVRALHQADLRLEGQEAFQVGGGPVQIRL